MHGYQDVRLVSYLPLSMEIILGKDATTLASDNGFQYLDMDMVVSEVSIYYLGYA